MSDYNLGIAAGKVVIDASDATSALDAIQKAAASIGEQVSEKVAQVEKFGRSLTVAGTAGVGAFGLAVKAASSFETGLSAIAAVSGATTAEMKKISDAALRIGKDTAYSATEAASAMEELVKGGLSVSDVLNGAADATVALAAAGGVSLSEAATIASNAMGQFGLTAEDMVGVVDSIAGAANASAIDVSQFGQSLGQVGAVANLTGLSFHDTAVAIAEMGKSGIKGSDAGTSLKTMFLNMIPTTDKQATEFRRLGLLTFNLADGMKFLEKNGLKPLGPGLEGVQAAMRKYAAESVNAKEGSQKAEKAYQDLARSTGVMENQFFDANGKIKSMAEIQGVLAQATKGMTEEQKLASLELLFGADAIRAAAILTKEGAEGFEAMSAAMGKVTAADVAKTRLDNLSGAMEALKGSFETAMITIGNVVLPMVRKFVDGLSFLVNIFNNAPEGVQKFIAIISALATGLSLLLGAFLLLIVPVAGFLAQMLGMAALRQVISVVATFGKTLLATRSMADAYSAAVARASVVQARFTKVGKAFIAIGKAMAAAWALATGPVGLIVLGIAALGAAFVLAYKNSETFRNFVDGIVDKLQNFFLPILERAKTFLSTFWAALTGNGEGLQFAGNLGKVQDAGQAIHKAFTDLVALFRERVMPALADAGEIIKAALGDAFEKIASVVQESLLPAFRTLADAFMNSVVPAVMKIYEVLAPIVVMIAKVAAVIVGVFIVALYKLAEFVIGTLLPPLISFYANVLAKIIEVLAAVVVVVIQVIAKLLEFVATILSSVGPALSAVGGFFKDVWEKISDLTAEVWGFISEQVSDAINAVKEVIETVLGAIGSAWEAFWSVFGGPIKAVFELIKALLALAFAVIELLFDTALLAIMYVWEKTWTAIKNFIVPIWDAIKTTITVAIGLIKTAISTAWEAIKTATTVVWGAIKAAIDLAWTNIKNAVTNSINAVKAVITAVWEAIKTATSAAWNAVKSAVEGPFNATKNYITMTITNIKTMMGNILNTFKDLFSNAFQAINDATGGKVGDLINFVKGIPGRILSALGNLKNLLVNAGRDIIMGLINGITEKIGALTDKLKSITKLIPDVKGPPETDKVLLEENGQFIMQGLIRGIESQIPPLTGVLQAIGTAIPGDMEVDTGEFGVSATGEPSKAVVDKFVEIYQQIETATVEYGDRQKEAARVLYEALGLATEDFSGLQQDSYVKMFDGITLSTQNFLAKFEETLGSSFTKIIEDQTQFSAKLLDAHKMTNSNLLNGSLAMMDASKVAMDAAVTAASAAAAAASKAAAAANAAASSAASAATAAAGAASAASKATAAATSAKSNSALVAGLAAGVHK